MKMMKLFLFTLICISPSLRAQNLIINGSFENNTASTNTLDLTTFWSTMVSNSYEVDGGSMDLITANNCGNGSQGNWFVTCSPQGGSWPYMAFSLELSSPLIAGSIYTLTLDNQFCGPNSSAIEVGLTNDSTSIGTIFHTFPAPTLNSWTTVSFTFTAASAAKFLSVNVGVAGSTGTIAVDNFILESGGVGINEITSNNFYINTSSSGIININSKHVVENTSIFLYDILGNLIYTSALKEAHKNIDISAQSKGVYFVRIENGNHNITKKVIIQ